MTQKYPYNSYKKELPNRIYYLYSNIKEKDKSKKEIKDVKTQESKTCSKIFNKIH